MANSVAHFVFALLLLLLNPAAAAAQSINGSIRVGASLSATGDASSWTSPSGDFAFGFQQLTDNDIFLLSIWYDKIPDKTIVWHANSTRPAPKGSKVELTADRGLVLSNPQGEELWKSGISHGTVDVAVMNDTGNFVLKNSESEELWDSFSYPTDTLLPSQILGRGGLLYSRQSDTNYSKGRFQLRLQGDGDLQLYTINLPTDYANSPYYKSGTVGVPNVSSAGIRLVFNNTGDFYILRDNGNRFYLGDPLTTQVSNFYQRVTLNFDGVLTQSYYPKASTGNESWSNLWSQPENICLAESDASSGTCGFNSICTLGADSRPLCNCPRGYSLLDPSDPYGTCKPDFILNCEEDVPPEELYDFTVLLNTDWPRSDYALFQPFTEDECRQSCLNDCMCAVAIFRAGDICWKKKLPLSNGKVDPGLYGGKALVKYRKNNAPPQFGNIPAEKQKKNQDGLILAGSVLLGGSMLINLLLIATICIGFYFIYHKRKEVQKHEGIVETNLQSFSYKDLVKATDGFKEELGRGAFGVVYKGVIQTSSTISIAVKKLNTSVFQDGLKEFKTEVNVIGRTHHRNLVRLIGYCEDEQERLLVYEFLSNGTLASFLFGGVKSNWNQRVEIALGIARGLLYMHEECSTQIIHCDIKPQNILLDDYYSARISDFGLAKLLMMDQSQTQTAIRGTKGYVAPEWFRNLPITVKVDIYSFGVLLLEIICCRRCVDMETPDVERAILTDWAYDCYREGALEALVENDSDALSNKGKLNRLVKVAIWCIQEDPSLRPTMKKVTQMLEGVVQVTEPPCPFRFTNPTISESTKLDSDTAYSVV